MRKTIEWHRQQVGGDKPDYAAEDAVLRQCGKNAPF